jgi:hypothetical protein
MVPKVGYADEILEHAVRCMRARRREESSAKS